MQKPVSEPLSQAMVRSWLPALDPNRSKYSAGQVILLGGFPGMEGAAWLAASGALRSGAGLVRWVRETLTPPPSSLPEIVQMSVLKEEGRGSDPKAAIEELKRTHCVLVGVGTTHQAPPIWLVEIIQAAQEQHVPIVWDGGAFHWIKEGWVAPRAGDCLTPHAGELQSLLKAAGHDRQGAAQELALRWGAVVVAKGPVTFICAPGCQTRVSHQGDPGMATAGTGDVLAGILAGLIAQGLLADQAAGLAVWLHSRAGVIAAAQQTSYCLTASSLLHTLPEAFQELLEHPER